MKTMEMEKPNKNLQVWSFDWTLKINSPFGGTNNIFVDYTVGKIKRKGQTLNIVVSFKNKKKYT